MKLLDYIQGDRKGKAAHRTEREAMNDPFLAEALEGFDSVEGDHTEVIARLQHRVTTRASRRRRRRLRSWSVAAAIALFLGLGGVYLGFVRHRPELPQQTLAELQQELEAPLAATDTVTVVVQADRAPAGELAREESASESSEPVESTIEILSIDPNHQESSGIPHPQDLDQVEGGFAPAPVAVAEDVVQEEDVPFASLKHSDSVVITLHEAPLSDEGVVAPGTSEKHVSQHTSLKISGVVSSPLADSAPHPVDGWKSFYKYIAQHQVSLGIEGEVLLEFRINRRGRPQNIRVKKSLSREADSEAIRLLHAGPDWSPIGQTATVTITF